MLCCLFIHRSQIQTSAARILLNCFGEACTEHSDKLVIGLQALATISLQALDCAQQWDVLKALTMDLYLSL